MRVHHTVSSDDILEYSNDINPKDVEFIEEDDIEYRDGRLLKASETIHLSVDRRMSERESDGDDDFSDVVTAHGSFSMELKECRTAPKSRRRREKLNKTLKVVPQWRRHSWPQTARVRSMSSSLYQLHLFITGKVEMERLEHLRQILKNSQDVIAALQDTNNSKICVF